MKIVSHTALLLGNFSDTVVDQVNITTLCRRYCEEQRSVLGCIFKSMNMLVIYFPCSKRTNSAEVMSVHLFVCLQMFGIKTQH
jgi:hypothetical protein